MDKGLVNKKPLYILLGISIVLYLMLTVFFTAGYLEFRVGEESLGLDFVLFFAIFILLLGSVGYGVVVILSFIGFIISVRKRSKGLSKKVALWFFCLVVLAIVTEIIFIILFKSLA